MSSVSKQSRSLLSNSDYFHSKKSSVVDATKEAVHAIADRQYTMNEMINFII
jgi:hypothetical protein